MATEYVLRLRQADGTWRFDLDTPMSKRDAERCAQINRGLGGVLCQVWTLKEAEDIAAKTDKLVD